MGFIKVGNKQFWYDADFKESEHPRAKNGRFGEKGSGEGAKVSLPKGLEHLVKSDHKNIASLCGFLLKSGHSHAAIAQAAQSLFGGKTSVASVSWYASQAKKQSKEGKAETKAKLEGMAKNDTKIAEAEKNPMPPKEMDKKLTEAEKPGYKSVFIKTIDSFGKTQFVKMTGVPDGLDSFEGLVDTLNSKGLKVQLVSPFSSTKAAPPNLKTFTMSESEITLAKDKAYKKAEAEAKSKAPVTELESKLDSLMVKAVEHYTNGSYGELNSCLRKGKPMSEAQSQLAYKLDVSISRSRATEDFTVYRGCAKPQSFFGPTPTIGSIVIDNGYISTSKNPNTAHGFGGAGMVAIIKVAKGCKALDVSSMSLHGPEKEVILPRGAMFKITAIKGKQVECDYVCG